MFIKKIIKFICIYNSVLEILVTNIVQNSFLYVIAIHKLTEFKDLQDCNNIIFLTLKKQ